MTVRPPHVAVTAEPWLGGIWEVPFWNLAADRGYRHLRRGKCRSLASEAPALDGGRLLFSDGSDRIRRLWIYAFDGAAALVVIRAEDCAITVAATEESGAGQLLAGIQAAVADDAEPDGRVVVTYWSDDDTGPARSSRRLLMPEWTEVATNYPAALVTALAPIVGAPGPAGGRLLLWHGPPGTGKTTALRALAAAWEDWAEVHYVVDPECFFGSARYMTEVLLERDGASKATLLVLEDAGELITPGARADTGQGLSRLLNLTDGMLGQGIDTIVLITTNEPLSSLHPAAARSGRCWAEVAFAPHSRDEANRWLATQGCDVRVSQATPLAELFALAAGARRPLPRRIGFG